MAPWVRPVARDTRRSTERLDQPSTSPCKAAGTTGSCTSRPARTSLSTKTSALSGPGSSHPSPSSQNDVFAACGNVSEPSTSCPGGSPGMNVPRLNWIPKNSASSGIGAVVAFVSGPRTVSRAVPRCRVTTISQWLTATEMKDSAGSLHVCHVCSIMGERDDCSSNVNNSTARFITISTDHDARTHRSGPAPRAPRRDRAGGAGLARRLARMMSGSRGPRRQALVRMTRRWVARVIAT